MREYPEYTSYKKSKAFIEKVMPMLPEDWVNSDYTPALKGLNEAEGMITGNATQEHWCFLDYVAARWAHRAAFQLFRMAPLPEDIEKEYRELSTPEKTTEAWKKYKKIHDDEANELEAKRMEFVKSEQARELFQAVATGMPKDEALRKQQEYIAQLAKMK